MSFIFVENCKGLHTKLSPPPHSTHRARIMA